MKDLVKEVLSPFKECYHSLIIEYGKRLSEYSREYDVLIFMARKSVCFAEMLRYLRLSNFESIVTSNRILDFDLNWLKGKRVAIIDDALITGTSLYQVKKKLSDICLSVDVYVLCINEEFWSKELIEPKKPYAVLSDIQTAEICSDIVDSISLVPIPYATDYPLYPGFVIDESDYEALFSSGDWMISDVSSSLQQRKNVFTKTFEPTKEIYRKLTESVGMDLSSNCLVKVRFYERVYERKRKNIHWCCVLPIVAFEPLEKEVIDKIFDELMSFGGISENKYRKWFSDSKLDVEACDESYSAKLRLINYVIASRLAAIWFESVQKPMLNKDKGKLDVHGVNYLFPYNIVDDVLSIMSKKGLIFSEKLKSSIRFDDNEKHIPYTEDIEIGTRYCGADGWSIEMCLTQPFISLYDNYELKAREIAKEYGKKIFEDEDIKSKYKKYVKRLDYGFSLKEISVWLRHLNRENYPVKKAISIFLDKMIDRGVVVPMICVKDNFVFRAYRHGEDVNFGLEEKRIVGIMLASFSKGLGKKELSGVDIEKATVMLIRRGLDEGFLVKPEKNVMGAPNTIGIRFSLHGAVVEQNSKTLYDHNSKCSIRDILVQAGYLSIDENVKTKGIDSKYYRIAIEGKKQDGVREIGIVQAKKLGYILGTLRAEGKKIKKKSRLTRRELILLATISSTRDLLAALGAEINIASQVFLNSMERYLRKYEDASEIDSMLSYLRDAKRNYLFVAIHSGSWKYHEYKQGQVWKIINRIRLGFEEEGKDLNALEWESLWAGKQNQLHLEDERLGDLILEASRWIFEMRIYYLLYEIAFIFFYKHPASFNGSASQFKIVNELRILQQDIKNYDIAVASLIDKLIDRVELCIIDSEKLKSYSIKKIKEKCAEAIDLTKTIDLVAGNYGIINEYYRYANSLLIKVSKQSSRLEDIINNIRDYIVSQIHIYSKKYNLIDNSIRVVPVEYFGERNDMILVVSYANKEFEFLIDLVVGIMKKFIAKSDFGFIMMYGMPPNMRFYAPKATTEFYGKMAYDALRGLEKKYDKLDNNLHLACTGMYYTKKSEVSSCIGEVFSKVNADSILFVEDICAKLFIETYQLDYLNIMKNGSVDVGIITVVADEARAVNAVLKKYSGFMQEVAGERTGYDYTIGNIPSKDGQVHTVACVQALKQGNTAIMPIYQAMVDEFNPILIVLIGIGGRVDNELDICDVCVPNYVLNYDFRAETKEGPKRTFDPLPPLEQWIIKIISRMQREWGEILEFDACDDSYRNKFRVSLGPIGSGGAVVKDENSETKEWLKTVSRKVSSLDTEATGFAQQYQSDKLKPHINTKGFMIVRGISDKADADKNKDYRIQPATNAMLFLEKFLSLSNKSFIGDV